MRGNDKWHVKPELRKTIMKISILKNNSNMNVNPAKKTT